MTGGVDHIAGQTFHGRKGAVKNAFSYGVDYLLVDAEKPVRGPRLFSRNARNLLSLHDADHGGERGAGSGAAWVRRILAEAGLESPNRIDLLAQPRVLGHVFNPVSLWLCYDAADTLRVVVPEVNNTFGDRHSYLAHRDDHGPIGPGDVLQSRKVFHVSPFQPIEGGYKFRFDVQPDKLHIVIDYADAADGGLVATLTGPRVPLTTGGILRACLRRPFGSRRVLALIHWQALKLWWKRAPFRRRPAPPLEEVSR